MTYLIHGWKLQFAITFGLANVRSRSGFPDNRELQLIRPQITDDSTLPLLRGALAKRTTERALG